MSVPYGAVANDCDTSSDVARDHVDSAFRRAAADGADDGVLSRAFGYKASVADDLRRRAGGDDIRVRFAEHGVLDRDVVDDSTVRVSCDETEVDDLAGGSYVNRRRELESGDRVS